MKFYEINESIIRLSMRYGTLFVAKNPSHIQTTKWFQKYHVLRGEIDSEKNLYVWDASEATHGDVEEFLGVDIIHRFMMYGSAKITTENDDENELKNIKSIKIAYGGDFDVENDRFWDDDEDDDEE